MVCLHAQDSIHRWKWARLVTFLSSNYVQTVLSKTEITNIYEAPHNTYFEVQQHTLFMCIRVQARIHTYDCVLMVACYEQCQAYQNTSWLDCCILLRYNYDIWCYAKSCMNNTLRSSNLVSLTFHDSKTWMVFGFLIMAPETP